MTRPDPQTCGWTALVFLGAAVSVACFVAAGRAIAEVRYERRTRCTP